MVPTPVVEAIRLLASLEAGTILLAGLILFGVTWVRPTRLVTMPAEMHRRRLLGALGIGGSSAVLVASIVANAAVAAAGAADVGGFSQWWMRPLALAVAAVVLLIALIGIASGPSPAPGARALVPRRSWRTFAPRAGVLAIAVVTASLAPTLVWQIAIATTAPEGANLFGRWGGHTDLPVWMSFNDGYAYVAGVGWPNHLATLVVLVVSLVVLWILLRTDANGAVAREASLASVRESRATTASVCTLLLLGGSLATWGAVWMFVGFTGQIVAGVGEGLEPDLVIGTGYAAIARPMQLVGYGLQAAAVALLLRLIVDTIRALRVAKRSEPVAEGVLR